MTGCINASINRQIKNLESYIKRFENNVTEDDIHDFRVSVKRLRAYRYFLRIINQLKLNIGNNLEMAYLAAGRLRDTTNKSLYLKIIKSAKSSKALDLEKLENTKNVYLQDFVSLLQVNGDILQPISDDFYEMSDNNQYIRISELQMIYSVVIANLYEELNKTNSDIDLHEVRKLFKKLSYLFELVNEFNPTDQAKNDHKIAVRVEKKLGIWHDMYVLKLEEENFHSLNPDTIEKLETEYGVKDRENLILFARDKMKRFQLIPALKI